MPRTLIDLAEVVTIRALERTVDETERLGLFDQEAIDAAIERNAGRAGTARLSWLLRAHSLPSPAVNARVGSYVVDFLWREQRVIVETDGHATHGTRAAFERDRARDARLTAAGYRVLRFTYRQIAHEPAQVAALVGAVLR